MHIVARARDKYSSSYMTGLSAGELNVDRRAEIPQILQMLRILRNPSAVSPPSVLFFVF